MKPISTAAITVLASLCLPTSADLVDEAIFRLQFAGNLDDTGGNEHVSNGIGEGGVGTYVTESVPAEAVGSNGRALVFDGVDDQIAFAGDVGAGRELFFGGERPFTLFVRVKFDKLEGIEHLFSRWTDGHSFFWQGHLAFGLRATEPRALVGCSVRLEPDRWYDVVGVYRGPGDDNMSLFVHDTVSGGLVGAETKTIGSAIDESTKAIFVGSRGGRDFFCGKLESVLAFDRALTEDEVRSLTTTKSWDEVQQDRFTKQTALTYGDPELLVPFPGAASTMDWDGDGLLDICGWRGLFRNSGEVDANGLPVYESLKQIGLPGDSLADLDGDGNLDCVTAHKTGFTWWAESREGGERTFVTRGDLQHPLGRAVPIPESGESTPRVALADWDDDGRVDLISGTKAVGLSRYLPREGPGFGKGWADGTWYFRDMTATLYFHRNVGTREKPLFTDGRLLTTGVMERGITFFDQAWPTVVDWNGDGLKDLFVSTFDRVIVFLNVGAKGKPLLDDGHVVTFGGRPTTQFERRPAAPFRGPDGRWRINLGGSQVRQATQLDAADLFAFGELQMLRCHADGLRLANFSVPDVADWDGDGKRDLVVGTEDGFVWFVRNLDPNGGVGKWAAPVLLEADGAPIRPLNIKHLQGPCEWWWAYTNPCVVDWDLDGDLDLVLGYVGESYLYYENLGTAKQPKLAARGHLRCDDRAGGDTEVSCSWRTRPGADDLDGDGLPDLVGIDGERHLCWWRRYRDGRGILRLSAPAKPVDRTGEPFIACGSVRGTGRTKLAICDWDHDGTADILASPSVHNRGGCQLLFRGRGLVDGKLEFELQDKRIHTTYSGHYTMVEPVDFDGDGKWEVLNGRDNGYVYYWAE